MISFVWLGLMWPWTGTKLDNVAQTATIELRLDRVAKTATLAG